MLQLTQSTSVRRKTLGMKVILSNNVEFSASTHVIAAHLSCCEAHCWKFRQSILQTDYKMLDKQTITKRLTGPH